MRRLSLGLLLVALGCGSTGGSRPADLASPEVTIRLGTRLFFGSGTTAPLILDVDVTNRAKEPITVRSIRVTSPGMVQYAIVPARRYAKETIQPGETRTISVPATAVASRPRLMPSEPLTIRAEIDFEARGKRFFEFFHLTGINAG